MPWQLKNQRSLSQTEAAVYSRFLFHKLCSHRHLWLPLTTCCHIKLIELCLLMGRKMLSDVSFEGHVVRFTFLSRNVGRSHLPYFSLSVSSVEDTEHTFQPDHVNGGTP